MTKMKILQNKINDKTIPLDEREDRFLDLQILELNENERQEKRYLKKVHFIINNLLDNKNYSFEIHYFINEDDYYSNFNFFKISYKKNNKQNYKKINIYDYLLTKEEHKSLALEGLNILRIMTTVLNLQKKIFLKNF